MWALTVAGLYASFLKGQGLRGLFSLVKAPPHEEIVNFLLHVLEHFTGTKATTRGHGGNRLCCLIESIGPWFYLTVCPCPSCTGTSNTNLRVDGFG